MNGGRSCWKCEWSHHIERNYAHRLPWREKRVTTFYSSAITQTVSTSLAYWKSAIPTAHYSFRPNLHHQKSQNCRLPQRSRVVCLFDESVSSALYEVCFALLALRVVPQLMLFSNLVYFGSNCGLLVNLRVNARLCGFAKRSDSRPACDGDNNCGGTYNKVVVSYENSDSQYVSQQDLPRTLSIWPISHPPLHPSISKFESYRCDIYHSGTEIGAGETLD